MTAPPFASEARAVSVGRNIGRRLFVRQSFGTMLACPLAMGLSASAAACASLATRVVTPVNGSIHLALTHYPELAEPGGSLIVAAEGSVEPPVYVLALDNGRYSALSPICTHLGCTVEIEDSRLVCPCHGSTYDREGNVLKGPAARALTRYAASLSADGVVMVVLRSPS